MKMTMIRRYILALFLALLIFSCDDNRQKNAVDDKENEYKVPPGEPIICDLTEIQDCDTLLVLTMYNSTSYFLYRGEPMGFEYELLREFCNQNDLNLKTIVVKDRDSLFYLLNKGIGDVVAARLNPREIDSSRIGFTRALYETAPTLIQRSAPSDSLAPEVDTLINEAIANSVENIPGIKPKKVEFKAKLIENPSELSGKTVHAPSNTAYVDRLVELSDSINGEINVVEVEGDVEAETLFRLVAGGAIEYAVAPLNISKLTTSYYTNITAKPLLDEPYKVTWALRRNAPNLKKALDDFLNGNPGLLKKLYDKYYINRSAYEERVVSKYLTNETGSLSRYDGIIKEYAKKLGWDWRLLASQTFQESRFDPNARSWAGATGLLQLMPATAREFGVRNMRNPDENVKGAVKFLQWLTNYWDDEIKDRNERLKFILASYNTGAGHVEDARRLAKKHGDNPNRWEDVSYWLLQKSRAEIYNDPVVKYGFSRGLEPVTYVSRILSRYDHYRQFVTKDGAKGKDNKDRG